MRGVLNVGNTRRSGRLIALCLAAALLPGCGAGGSAPRPPDHEREQSDLEREQSDHDRESPDRALQQTARPPCPGVNVSGPGDPAGSSPAAKSYRVLAEPVYRAACAGDDRRLARLIDEGSGGAEHFATNSCQGCDASEIVDMWRNDYGLDLTELARLLETPPHWTQGGPLYIKGNRIAAFNRGWSDVPASWSAFYPDCLADEHCQMASGVVDGA